MEFDFACLDEEKAFLELEKKEIRFDLTASDVAHFVFLSCSMSTSKSRKPGRMDTVKASWTTDHQLDRLVLASSSASSNGSSVSIRPPSSYASLLAKANQVQVSVTESVKSTADASVSVSPVDLHTGLVRVSMTLPKEPQLDKVDAPRCPGKVRRFVIRPGGSLGQVSSLPTSQEPPRKRTKLQ